MFFTSFHTLNSIHFALDQLIVQAILGEGFQTTDLRVECDGKAMMIHSTTSGPKKTFQKRISLPVLVEKTEVEANYRDFLLTIKCKVKRD